MLSLEEKAAALNNTKLFKYADKADLLVLAEHLQDVTYAENSEIFKQGETFDTAYYVIEGRVNIYIDDILMAHYDKGQVFGELSMLDNTPYSATAKTVVPTRLLAIPSDILFRTFHQTENLAVAIIKALSKRLKRHLIV